MQQPLSRAAIALSIASALCAAVASAATLVWPGAFPEPPGSHAVNTALAEARGWSAITLCAMLPLFVVALRAARRRSTRGQLAWLGTLAYLVYTYLEFAVSPPFTALYLLYISAFAAAIPPLVMGAASIDRSALPAIFARAPRRTIAIFSLFVGVGLAAAWLKIIAARTCAGEFGWPTGDEAIGHVVRALDLGLQVPLALSAGILLLRARAAGYLVAGISLVSGACMTAALTAMVAFSSAPSGASVFSAAPFAVLAAVTVGMTGAFYRND